MIPLLLVGLTVLVLGSMVKGDRREVRGASPVVPPPPPRLGSTVVVSPDPQTAAWLEENDRALEQLRRDSARAEVDRRASEASFARAQRLLREAEAAQAANDTELDMIEEDARRLR